MRARAYILLIGGALACDDTSVPSFEEPVPVSLELVVQGLSFAVVNGEARATRRVRPLGPLRACHIDI